MDGAGTLQRTELDFFLKGDTSLAAPTKPSPAACQWLSPQGWKDLLCLGTLHPAFAALLLHFEQPSNAAVWKAWYDLEAPEHAPLPWLVEQKQQDGSNDLNATATTTATVTATATASSSDKAAPSLTPLQKLCVMRCFRPDRVYNAAKGMVSVHMHTHASHNTPRTSTHITLLSAVARTSPVQAQPAKWSNQTSLTAVHSGTTMADAHFGNYDG